MIAPLALLALVACGEAPEPEAAPTPTPTVAAPRTLVAADFDPEMLGAKIVGPQGSEPEAAIMADGREIARIKSFVACPAGTAVCAPADMPEGTVYTYVHEITLAAEDEAASETVDVAAAEQVGTATGAVQEVPAALFRMTRPATGFNRSVGYSRAQAEAALGATDAIKVIADAQRIIWRVTGGSGWKPGSALTVWWQSTTPPQGPAEAYRLEVDGLTAAVTAPFPEVDE